MSHLLIASIEMDVLFWETTWIIFRKILDGFALLGKVSTFILPLTFAIFDEYLY